MENTSEIPFLWNEGQDAGLLGQLGPSFQQAPGLPNATTDANGYTSPFSGGSLFEEKPVTFVTEDVSFLKVLYGIGAPMKEDGDVPTDSNTTVLEEVMVEAAPVITAYDYRKYIDKENHTEGYWEHSGNRYYGYARLNTQVGELAKDKLILAINKSQNIFPYTLYKPYNKGSHSLSYLEQHAAIQLCQLDIDGLLLILRNLEGVLDQGCLEGLYKKIAADFESRLNRGDISGSIFFYLTKQVLKYFSTKTLLKYFYGILSEAYLFDEKEKTILNLIRGLKNHKDFQPDEFLRGLLKADRSGYIPFKKLYDDMNDWGGDNNFSQIILELTMVWMLSSFSDGENKIYKDKKYTPPISLPYQPQKVLGFTYDGFDIVFDEKMNISIIGDPPVFDLDSFERALGTDIKLLHHPFQPMTVAEKSENVEGFNLEGGVPVPAFYIKAIDDKSAWDNFEKGAWLVLDIVSTFTGIGNLTKLRYLIKAGKATSIIILRTAYGIIEVTAGVMSIGLSLIENNENREWVYKIRSYLFWAEICTLGADLATTKILARQANDARAALNEYRRTVRNQKRLAEIDAFGTHLDEVGGAAAIQRGRYLGQVIDRIGLSRISAYLKKVNVEFQIGSADGLVKVDGYTYKSGKDYYLQPNEAALFITDGTNMRIVLRENATVYEFLHELMHLRDCKKRGMGEFLEVSRYKKEKFVFDRLMEYSTFLNKRELEHAHWYINRTAYRYGVDEVSDYMFDINKIPVKRQEVNIDKILNLE